MSAGEDTPRRPMSPGAMRLALGGSALLVAAGLAAFWFAARSRPAEDASGQIAVTVSDGRCDPADFTVPAGRTSFRISNASDRTLEWEILDGVMVVAERENIAPGFESVLTERLKPGVYAITCGLLSNPRGRLEVLATAESEAARAQPEMRAFIGPLSEYRVYLSRRSSELIDAVDLLSERIGAGDVEGARAAWLDARRPWRQMAPVSGRIGDLANRMDPLAAYLEGREADPGFTGFHRIEQGLWQASSTEGLAPFVDAARGRCRNPQGTPAGHRPRTVRPGRECRRPCRARRRPGDGQPDALQPQRSRGILRRSRRRGKVGVAGRPAGRGRRSRRLGRLRGGGRRGAIDARRAEGRRRLSVL